MDIAPVCTVNCSHAITAGIHLRVLLISNYVPGFPSLLWTVRIALSSFLHSFRLPDPRVCLELYVYMQCSQEPLLRALPYEAVASSTFYEAYTRNLVSVVQKFNSSFQQTELFCSSYLDQAHCHAANFLPPNSYAFTMEHDWFFSPSLLSFSMFTLLQLMKGKQIDFLRFNKYNNELNVGWDYNLVEKHLNGIPLIFWGGYSNNPHIISSQHLRQLAAPWRCQTISEYENLKKRGDRWEQRWHKLCKKCRANFVFSNGVWINSSKKGGCCFSYIYGRIGLHATVKHIDGRRLHSLFANKSGFMFSPLQNLTFEVQEEVFPDEVFVQIIDTPRSSR